MKNSSIVTFRGIIAIKIRTKGYVPTIHYMHRNGEGSRRENIAERRVEMRGHNGEGNVDAERKLKHVMYSGSGDS